METKNQYSWLRWTARIISALLLVFTIIMAIGSLFEGIHGTGKTSSDAFNFRQIITFAFWGMGLAGLVWAWWKEGAGGFLSFFSTIIFLILVLVNPTAHFAPVLLAFLLPSVLFIIYWWLSKRTT